MTGMDVVIALRRSGVKPSAVFIDLVKEAPRDPYALGPTGIVNINIARTDSLAEIDFRPLVGLRVHVIDHVDDRARHRKVAAMVAAVNPVHLTMPVWEGDTLAVHQRWAGEPARTETYRT